MIALLVAAFILYLYTPHLLFKFAAATKYDFITRKELPQVEEFFAAGLPSLFLNGITFVVLWVTYRLVGADPIIVKRSVVASVFTKEPDLSPYFGSADLSPLFCYVGALAFISWWSGRMYGGIIRKVALAGGEWEYVLAAGKARLPWNKKKQWSLLFRIFFAFWRVGLILYRRSWRIFYAPYEHPLYPVVIRNSYAFVHTARNLYHGILFQLDKKRDGDVEGIILVGVSRFSRKKEDECFRQGVNPISEMTGPLFIKWGEITDINYPPDASILEKKRKFYDGRIAEYAAAKAKRRVLLAGLARLRKTRKK